jgi:hypothetical protein
MNEQTDFLPYIHSCEVQTGHLSRTKTEKKRRTDKSRYSKQRHSQVDCYIYSHRCCSHECNLKKFNFKEAFP